MKAVPPDILPILQEAAAAANVPLDLFIAQMHQESGFNPKAVSTAGAQGIGQLMPATARSLGVRNPFDPRENAMAAARYLSQQKQTFGTWPLALAAYNAGPGNVRKHGGVPPFAETQNYVNSILSSLGTSPSPQPQAPQQETLSPELIGVIMKALED